MKLKKLLQVLLINISPSYRQTTRLLKSFDKHKADEQRSIDRLMSQLEARDAKTEEALRLLNHEITTQHSVIEQTSRLVRQIESEVKTVKHLPACGENLPGKKPNVKNVLLIGYYGEKNFGDELMLNQIWKYLKKRSDLEVSIMLMGVHNYDLDQWSGARLYAPPSTEEHLNNITNYFDEVIVGGGAHIDDRPVKDLSYIPYLAIRLSKYFIDSSKVVKWIGVSSNSNLANKDYCEVLGDVINGSKHFSLRDEISYAALKDADIDMKNVSLINDIAFSVDPNVLTVGITLINHMENYDKLLIIVKDLAQYARLDKHGRVQLCLIPFFNHRHSDTLLYNRLLKDLDDDSLDIYIAPEYTSVESMLMMLKSCDILVNMRYHASLLGLHYGIPTISICYDIHPHYFNKITYLHNMFNNNNVVQFSEYEFGDVQAKLKKIKLKKSAESPVFEKTRSSLEDVLSNTFEQV